MYIAVLEKDCNPHYFAKKESAATYLIENVEIAGCVLDLSKHGECAEL